MPPRPQRFTNSINEKKMRTEVEFGTLQQEIVETAKAQGAKYIVIWTDHYPGNGKGYYQTVGKFAESRFGWNWRMDDRGATSVWLTDEDVPAMVKAREGLCKRIMNATRDKFGSIQAISEAMGGMWKIDGRWGENNPKRVKAVAHNDKLRERIRKEHDFFNSVIDGLQRELEAYNFVSSTFIEY